MATLAYLGANGILLSAGPESNGIWLYAAIFWAGAWWMLHPRLPANFVRYLINVGALYLAVAMFYAVAYLVLLVVFGGWRP